VPARPVRARLVGLLAIVFALAACGGDDPPPSSGPGSGTTFANTSWIVLLVNDRAPVAGAVPTITFSADSITGTGGCNHLGGHYRFDPSTGQIAVRELGSTAMGCLQAGVSDYETLFLQALGTASEATIDAKGQLNLRGPGGRILLVALEHPGLGG
jgi:heat shock protein HslJ